LSLRCWSRCRNWRCSNWGRAWICYWLSATGTILAGYRCNAGTKKKRTDYKGKHREHGSSPTKDFVSATHTITFIKPLIACLNQFSITSETLREPLPGPGALNFSPKASQGWGKSIALSSGEHKRTAKRCKSYIPALPNHSELVR
jgi:hypothetical protein